MKTIITNVFYNRAGFDVYRYGICESVPFVVDVIGPPGVGKSRLIKCLIKENVLNGKRQKFDKTRTVCKSRAFLLSLASTRLNDISILQKKATKILYDLNIHSTTSIVLVDEGLCQHFMNELCLLANERPNDFNLIMKKRAMINLTASPRLINDRIRDRTERGGALRSYHKHKTEEQLSRFNTQFLEQSEALALLMMENKFPTITVDASKKDDIIVGQIASFLSSLAVYKQSDYSEAN